MPIVDKKMSSEMSKGGYRPTCSQCGHFIGEGGYYDVIYDDYSGGYEEGYSYCKSCFNKAEDGRRRVRVSEELKLLSEYTREYLRDLIILNSKAEEAFWRVNNDDEKIPLRLTRSELAKIVYATGKEARRTAPKVFEAWMQK